MGPHTEALLAPTAIAVGGGCMPLAAGVLAKWGILLHPAFGAVLMSLSTVVVALNAQLLRRTNLGAATGGTAPRHPPARLFR